MTKRGHITGFYLETLLLIAVFIAIILVLTHVFGLGQGQSAEAKLLTNAVCLAQNAAEAVSAAADPETLVELLDEGGNARRTEGGVELGYDADMRPAAGAASLRVSVTWEPSADGMVYSVITVYHGNDAVYALETAVFRGEAAA